VKQTEQELTMSQVSAKHYGLTATICALRAIFANNQEKSFEERWALAKSSAAYRGFQIRCRASAKALLGFAVPPLLFSRIISRYQATSGGIFWSTIVICGLYISIAIAVSWKLGVKAADAKMRSAQQTAQSSG
jgi:hypothetical protein